MWTCEQIVNLINTNDKMVAHSIKVLYDRQTADEQIIHQTAHSNGIGFNSIDSQFLSSCAEFYNRTGFLTHKQTAICRHKLVKYGKQLTKIANHEI